MRKARIIGLQLSEDCLSHRDYIDLPRFWLHGKAGEINGFDLSICNLQTFWYIMFGVSFLADIKLFDGKTYRAIVIVKTTTKEREGLICLIDDIEGIRNALEWLGIEHRLSFFDHHQKEIMKHHPELWELLLSPK